MSEDGAAEAARLILHELETMTGPGDIHARAVAPIAAWCSQAVIAQAIREARDRESGASRGFLMAELLPFLHDENRRRQLIEEELVLASLLERDKAGVIARLALIQALPDRERWILEAIEAAADLHIDVDSRAWALADLLSVLPATQRTDAAYPALTLLETPGSGLALSAAAELVGALAGAFRPPFIPRFHEVLTNILGGLPDHISEVLDCVATLSPMIGALGGPKAASSVAAAIQDACPWQ